MGAQAPQVGLTYFILVNKLIHEIPIIDQNHHVVHDSCYCPCCPIVEFDSHDLSLIVTHTEIVSRKNRRVFG